MLWQAIFFDTRWRFLFGLVLLTVTAAFVVMGYPTVAELVKAAPQLGNGGQLGREIAAAAAASSTYDGYIQSQWFRQNAAQLGSFFAAILGAGGLLSQGAAARMFTLSLPVSRERLFGLRAAAGLTQVLILAVVPALAVTLLSPLVHERFALLDTLAYALCVFAGTAAFFSLAFLMSTMLSNMWAPVLITICAGSALQMIDRLAGGQVRFSLLGMMHGDSYFRGDGLPWPMLLATAALTTALLYGAVRNIAHRDF